MRIRNQGERVWWNIILAVKRGVTFVFATVVNDAKMCYIYLFKEVNLGSEGCIST